jgi:hypothetical protein
MSKKFICPRCGYETEKKHSLKRHFQRKRVCEPINSNILIDDAYISFFGNNLNDLYASHVQSALSNLDSNICLFCSKEFANKASAKRHMKDNCINNPLKNPNNKIEYEKIDGKLIININNIDNSTQNNIQNIQNNNIVFNFINQNGTTTIMRENIKDFGEETVEDIADNIYKNAIKDYTQLSGINTITDKLHFGENPKFHNIRMVKPYNDAKHHRIIDLDTVMYIHNPEVMLVNATIDEGYVEDFEKMFTQILTKDGWKNVNIRDVTYLLIAFIMLKVEGYLDDKLKSVNDKTFIKLYEDKLKNYNTVQTEIRRLIKCYNKHGEIIPKELITVKNLQIEAKQRGVSVKEMGQIKLRQYEALVDHFNDTVQKLIETIKEKSSILHGEKGEKLIILNNNIDPENCTFESLVDGQYYEKLLNGEIIDINDVKESIIPDSKNDFEDNETELESDQESEDNKEIDEAIEIKDV